MFLVSNQSPAFSVFEGLERSASPACREIAVKLQICATEKQVERCTQHMPLPLPGLERDSYYCYMRSACQEAGVSLGSYLACEREVMQAQLDEMQESASGVTSTTERRKLGLNWGFKYGALTAPLYLNRAIKKALQELRESQCQQAEDGDV